MFELLQIGRIKVPTFIPILAFVGLLYVPVFFTPFASHDQYRYFAVSPGEKTSCDKDTQYSGIFFELGRPVQALIECSIFKSVHRVTDLTKVRALAVLLVGLAVFLFYFHIQSVLEKGVLFPFFLSVLVFTLPGIQNLVLMGNVANLFAIVLSIVSYRLFCVPIQFLGIRPDVG